MANEGVHSALAWEERQHEVLAVRLEKNPKTWDSQEGETSIENYFFTQTQNTFCQQLQSEGIF